METPLAGGVDKSFMSYRDEWNFINGYYKKHREVPSVDVFQSEFDNFDFYETDGVWEHYIQELHKWKARHVLQDLMMDSASRLKTKEGPFDLINEMQAKLSVLGRTTAMVKDVDLVANRDERIDNLQERLDLRASGKKLLGIPTGIETLDDMYGGLQKGDFWVIAGWTGSCKSWLALYMAMNAWNAGYRVLYFSLEMSALQLGYRFDTLLSGMGNEHFTNSGLTHAHEAISIDRYRTWLGEATEGKSPFTVITNEDIGDEIDENLVETKINHWQADVCVLDYHSLFDSSKKIMGEVEKTKELSKQFKRIAIRTGCPIIDITGVTMPQGSHGERPAELSELAWSKQLAYDSDLTLSLCKRGETLEVVSAKVRRSAEFKFFLNWNIDKGIVREMKTGGTFSNKEDDE